MPFAVSATTLSGFNADVSTNERTCSPNASSMSTLLDAGPATSPRDVTPDATISLICCRPLCSPTGAAPARHSLMPLYFAGLWLAVSIAPGASSRPDAK